ncbi:MAG: hypothetical protein LBB60_06725, partial [Desulfovibrio sp.]|nr:hypothetical protein [Desulfovibrio sp.]
MLIRKGRCFTRGLLLLVFFAITLWGLFTPVFPSYQAGVSSVNGLVYADYLFNTLSKSSSNFFDPSRRGKNSVEAAAATIQGQKIDLELVLPNDNIRDTAIKLLEEQGLQAVLSGAALRCQGDLYTLLMAVIADASSTYHNNLDEVTARHKNVYEGKAVMRCWWHLLTAMVKPLQKAGMQDTSSVVNTVIGKAIEPAYNFYGIITQKSSDNFISVAAFLG